MEQGAGDRGKKKEKEKNTQYTNQDHVDPGVFVHILIQ